jgi:hypothetical protein
MEVGHPPDGLQEQQQAQQQEQQQSPLTEVLFETTIEEDYFGDHVLEVRLLSSAVELQ